MPLLVLIVAPGAVQDHAPPGRRLSESRGILPFLLVFWIEEQAYLHLCKGQILDVHGKYQAI